MGGPHKHNPIPFRPGIKPGDPDGDRDWLLAYAAETGLSVSAVISKAVAAYRAKLDYARPLRDARETGDTNAEMRAGLREALTTETEATEGAK